MIVDHRRVRLRTLLLLVAALATAVTATWIVLTRRADHARADAAFRVAADWRQDDEPWIPFTFVLPDGVGTATLLFQRAHPLAISYDLVLRWEFPRGLPEAVALRTDSQATITVGWQPRLRLADGREVRAIVVANHIIDVDSARLRSGIVSDSTVIGRIDVGNWPPRVVAP